MNERIRELHREAEKWVADNFSTDELDPYEYWEKSEQKFAELIIQECIDVVEDEDDGSVDTRPVRWAVIRIKKHFGIQK